MNHSIDDLNLSVRAWNCLKRANLNTVEEVLNCDDLLKIRGMGNTIYAEITAKLKAYGKVGCKYCSRKPETSFNGYFYDGDNEEQVASGAWTSMYIGVDERGRLRLTACGDGRADYFPKYCPECGRKLDD